MFLRPHYRTVDGERQAYWSLVESVRTERGPRQRVVAYLGGLDEAGRLGTLAMATPTTIDDRVDSLTLAAADDESDVILRNGDGRLAWGDSAHDR